MEILRSLLYILNEMSPYVLLGFLIAGLMHAFIPAGTFARHLSGSGWKAVVKAALAGVPLPLCSCGVLPTAIAMRRAGASRAASSSFLIATPQTGIDSIAATASLLGPAFAVIRPLAAMTTALFGGLAVGITEKGQDSPAATCAAYAEDEKKTRRSPAGRLADALRYGYIDLVAGIGPWLIAGLVIAALITVYLPADALSALGEHPFLAMPAVLAIAVPMYVCATGSIPIAMSLMLKGLSPGTAFVLLMAGPAANFASAALVSREMGRKAAAVYIGSIIAGALVFGLAIDYLMPAHWFTLQATGIADACHASFPIFSTICSAILVLLIAWALLRGYINNHKIDKQTNENIMKLRITGMNCQHCRASVERAISSVEGVDNVSVDLTTGLASVDGNADADTIADAVRAAGFDAEKLPDE